MTQPVGLTYPALTALIENAVKSGDPQGIVALAEWMGLIASVAEMIHLINHVEDSAMQAAAAAARACIESRGGETQPLH